MQLCRASHESLRNVPCNKTTPSRTNPFLLVVTVPLRLRRQAKVNDRGIMPSGSQKNLNEAQGKRDDAQEQFQIAFDANPAPSAIIRLADAVVVKANPGLPEITGRDNREIEGKSVRDLELFFSTEAFEQAVDTLK